MNRCPALFPNHQFVEYCQHLLAVEICPVHFCAQFPFILVAAQKLRDKFSRDFNIPAQDVRGMAAQEEAIEQSGLPLRGLRVEFFAYHHRRISGTDRQRTIPGSINSARLVRNIICSVSAT